MVGAIGGSWNCEKKSVLNVLEILNKTQLKDTFESKCPLPCESRLSCHDCLTSPLPDSGFKNCEWSTSLSRCISPPSKNLLCIAGICGKVYQKRILQLICISIFKVLTKSDDVCPSPCSLHTECSSCLKHLRCGWCSLDSHSLSGFGLCTEGTLGNPLRGECASYAFNATLKTIKLNQGSRGQERSNGFLDEIGSKEISTSWHFAQCPSENECLNGHDDCNTESEDCVDKEIGFECHCKAGYELEEDSCSPVCDKSCQHGTCIAPNKCQCYFGFTGENCNIECKCNKNSNCEGPEALNVCLRCENNTQGPQCGICKSGFVGNPLNGEQCVSCSDYCSGHTRHCYGKDFLLDHRNSSDLFDIPAEAEDGEYKLVDEKTLIYLDSLGKEGPASDAICLNCQNGTRGPLCHRCIDGNFRGSHSFTDGCRPCFCNGHGDECNPITGGNCDCGNHTDTDINACSAKRSDEVSDDCWKLQCTKCKEYYVGDPVYGHQCYRAMAVDQDYCFDPNMRPDYCNERPGPLKPGETIFFAVQPKFMNVDIRVTVDVTQGAIDVILSAQSQLFIVEYNKSTEVHDIIFDPQFGLNVNIQDFKAQKESNDDIFFSVPFAGKDQFRFKELVKIEKNLNRRNTPQLATNMTQNSYRETFNLRTVEATGLSTFVALTKPDEVLFIKNVRHRLVISVPETSHDLRSSKFYLVLHGARIQKSELTLGNIFFRQDQLHIDLFVFFSVFFSCFFLFLAACVVFWKIKLVADMRRARRRHAVEMTIMAQRPFASQFVIIDQDNEPFLSRYHNSPSSRRRTKSRFQAVCSAHHHNAIRDKDSPTKRLLPEPDTRYSVRAITMEPTADGIAAVTSVLVQLPGPQKKLEIGSVLINTLRVFPGSGKILKNRSSNVNLESR